MKSNSRLRAWRTILWGAAVLAALLYLPTPYVVMAPGDAVDLSTAIRIDGYPAPVPPLYLTDVLLYPASPLGLLARYAPGYRLLRRSELEPGGVDPKQFQEVQRRSMLESQQAAAVVGERAAGYRVAVPASRVRVVGVLSGSHARGVLEPGDVVVAVDDKAVSSLARMVALVGEHPPDGPPVRLQIERGASRREISVSTSASPQGQPRIGVLITAELGPAKLPVPVRFGGELDRISGSSGGLMMALEIFRALERRPLSTVPVAGTGTIDYSGNVGPIDGAAQKVIAARRAGAKIFLCPKANFREIEGTPGIRVIPVATFGQALHELSAGRQRAA
ncbi:PDZ domain-containing protein [bacterium]|nr:MAG: PDZ domain-containing protein [bacterium]